MDQKRIDEMLKTQATENEQMVFQALQNQRKGALSELEKRANNLLETTSKLTKPELESERGAVVLANSLRELITAINSTQLALDAHDKFLDMVIQDLGASIQQAHGNMNGLLQVSMKVETMMKAAMDKGLLEEKDLEKAYKEVSEQAQEALQSVRDSVKNP